MNFDELIHKGEDNHNINQKMKYTQSTTNGEIINSLDQKIYPSINIIKGGREFHETYHNYVIISNNEEIGYITMDENNSNELITIGDIIIKDEYKNKGFGISTYIGLVELFQKPLISFIQSDSARYIRESLIQKGLAEKANELGYRFKDLSTLIEEGKAIKDLFTNKIKIIN